MQRNKLTLLESVFNKITDDCEKHALILQKKKNYFRKLLNLKSLEEMFIDEAMTLIDKTSASMQFPNLTFIQENALLNKLSGLNDKIKILMLSKLEDGYSKNKLFIDYLISIQTSFSLLAKKYFSIKKDSYFTMNYFTYYQERREVGLFYFNHYDIFKMKAKKLLKQFFERDKASEFYKTILHVLEQDKKGLNLYSKNDFQRFINLVKYLSALRWLLIERKETVLLTAIITLLDDALGIVRPTGAKTLLVQKNISYQNDPIIQKIICLDSKLSINDSTFKKAYFKQSIFSRKSMPEMKSQPPANEMLIAIKNVI